MSNRQETFSGTRSVPDHLLFDVAALEAYVRENTLPLTPPFTVEQFKGGQSNPTYAITDASGAQFVLRRKPPGKLLTSAHAIEREFRVIRALTNTKVPVPRAIALCEDKDVIGTPFYVMERVMGRIFWDAKLSAAERDERPKLEKAAATTLAAIHDVDLQAAGLSDYGKHGGYVTRQIERWTGQYRADSDAGPIPSMDRLIEWLPEHVPAETKTTLVHGDFRIDNLVFAADAPDVLAVLDWELSTLGDPMCDLAYALLPYRLPESGFGGLMGLDLMAENIGGEDVFLAAYQQAGGAPPERALNFYVVFSLFRLAAIVHGVVGRAKRGNASSKNALTIEAATMLADLGLYLAESKE